MRTSEVLFFCHMTMCGWLPPRHEGVADCRPDRHLFSVCLFKGHIHFARSRILLWTCSSKGETALRCGSASQKSKSCCMCEPMDTPSPSTMTHMPVAQSGHWTTRRWCGPIFRWAAGLGHRCVLETWTRADVNVTPRPLENQQQAMDDIDTKSSETLHKELSCKGVICSVSEITLHRRTSEFRKPFKRGKTQGGTVL